MAGAIYAGGLIKTANSVIATGAIAALAADQATVDFSGAARFGGWGPNNSTNGTVIIYTVRSDGTNYLTPLTVHPAGSVEVGPSGALATNATDGFLYIPTCAGTPSGTPTSITGKVPIIFDTTNNKLYIYDGSWLGGTTPGAFV